MRGVVLLAIFAVALASQQGPSSPTSDQSVPYCDEVDNHPSTHQNPSADTPSPIEEPIDSNYIPNAQQHAAEIGKLIESTSQDSLKKDSASFGAAVQSQLVQLGEMAVEMGSRQNEIDEIFSKTLPAFESSIDSRRKRASELRMQIKALNSKLRSLVDTLDRSAYVQEQQKLLNIIDGLMRIQNTIEMSVLGASSSFSVRPTETHPAHANALLSVHQEASIPKAIAAVKETVKEDPNVLEMLHALDLLEIESRELPYQRRASLLAKKIVSILGRLIDMFNDLRTKHKEYAKESRELWGKELDALQAEADDTTNALEAVMDQAHYYLSAYEKSKDRMTLLISEQRASLVRYEALRERLHRLGIDYEELTSFRATQLKKMQELLHYLTYGNAEYTESVFDFACDGVIGGSKRLDACGVCGGNNSTCMDCAGNINGYLKVDICGVCGGEGKSCSYFCDGNADSGATIDLCGECGGNGTLCVGCDGIPRSGLVLDRCGLCAGDGTTCGAEDITATVSNTTVIVSRIEIGMAFDPEWTSTRGQTLRSVVAAAVNVESSKIQIMSAGGQDSVAVDLSIQAELSMASTISSQFSKITSDGSLLGALKNQGVDCSYVKILDGPAIITPL